MNKKIIKGIAGIALIGCLTAIFTGCGKGKNDVNGKDEQVVENKVSEISDSNNISGYEVITAKYNIGEEDWIYNAKETRKAFDSYNNDDECGLYIDNIEKNSDNTYTIKGEVASIYKLTSDEMKKLNETNKIVLFGEEYKIYNEEKLDDGSVQKQLISVSGERNFPEYCISNDGTLSSNTQLGTCHRATNKKMEITVNADVLCFEPYEISLIEGDGLTIKEVYESKEETKRITGRPYNFIFKDGKCISMYPILYES